MAVNEHCQIQIVGDGDEILAMHTAYNITDLSYSSLHYTNIYSSLANESAYLRPNMRIPFRFTSTGASLAPPNARFRPELANASRSGLSSRASRGRTPDAVFEGAARRKGLNGADAGGGGVAMRSEGGDDDGGDEDHGAACARSWDGCSCDLRGVGVALVRALRPGLDQLSSGLRGSVILGFLSWLDGLRSRMDGLVSWLDVGNALA